MGITPNIAYHLRELSIARDPTSPSHAMPDFQASDRAILDIGCGIGQTLVAGEACSRRLLVGLDIDLEALRYGRSEFQHVDFIGASADRLPFRDGSFDLVVSRVALPYTHIGRSLADMARVLDDGGRIWLALHSFAKTREDLARSIRKMAIRDMVFRGYVITNGLLLHWLGREFPFPFNGRHESFQTARGMERQLRKSGFTDVRITTEPHFICTARRIARGS